MADNNLYALVISGHATIEELQDVWEQIRMEAADKGGDLEHRLYLNLFKEINALKSNIDEIRDLISIMQDTYTDQFAKKLNARLITNFAFDVTKPEEYDKLLQRCYNMTGGLQLRLTMLITNFKAIEEKNKDNKPPSREYYLSLLITLSDNAGYSLGDSITVFEFYERMARAQKRTEQLNKHHGR